MTARHYKQQSQLDAEVLEFLHDLKDMSEHYPRLPKPVTEIKTNEKENPCNPMLQALKKANLL